MQKFPCLDLNISMELKIRPQTVRFYEKKGIQFFRDFSALNKAKNPVNISIPKPGMETSIEITNSTGKKLGFFDLQFKKEQSQLDGIQLLSEVEHENIGELLTLSSLMEFSKNRLNNFKFFSLEETIPFHMRYGFIIDNDDPNYILNALKQITKSDLRNIDELKYRATFFYKKIKEAMRATPENNETLQRGCKVISDYIKFLTRNKLQKQHGIYLENGSDVKFTDYELMVEKGYLNSLLQTHKINYEF
ncbi:hypothetical protein IJ541_11320 [bacterium]|nr:hypothetical protein [bacterium]